MFFGELRGFCRELLRWHEGVCRFRLGLRVKDDMLYVGGTVGGAWAGDCRR